MEPPTDEVERFLAIFKLFTQKRCDSVCLGLQVEK
jgi:hypothetical protein